MARASKLLSLIGALCCFVGIAHAQATQPSVTAAAKQVAELQFDLARSLAQAGDHDAAAREFDRAMMLQRQAEHATTEQTQAALQTLRAYVESRPELPRIREIGRKLVVAERRVPSRSAFGPTSAIGAQSAAPAIVPNAPPAGAADTEAPVALNPYRHPPRGVAPGSAAAAPSPDARAFQLQAPHGRGPAAGAWWEHVTLRSDELLIPAEWEMALRGARAGGPWPHISMSWPELLIPDGWEQSNHGYASMLLVDAELLIPPGW